MREYISKLNDRNLKRKKATGITNYVLYSLVIVIVFKIIDLLKIIDFSDLETYSLTKLSWLSFCMALAIFFIQYSFMDSFKNNSSVRVLKVNRGMETYFSNVVASFMISSTIIPAFFMVKFDYENNTLTNYSNIERALILLTLFNIILLLIIWFDKNKDVFTTINKKESKTASILMFIVSLFVITSSLYLIINLSISQKIDLITLFLLVFATFAIFEKIISNYRHDTFSKDLENLEYEIYLKNLDDDSIRHILQSKYMGYLIVDWIVFKKNEIDEAFEKYNGDEENIEQMEVQLQKVDKKQYPIEYDGRKEKIDECKKELAGQIINFCENNQKEISEILNKDSSIELENVEQLKNLKNILESRINDVKNS